MNLREFRQWAVAQGSVANPAPNNSMKGQCVSLIQQYLYLVFGKPFAAHGNAIDWDRNFPKDYFTRLAASSKLQPGDVLVYGANFGGGFGHLGIIDDEGQFLDQNGDRRLAVGRRATPFTRTH